MTEHGYNSLKDIHGTKMRVQVCFTILMYVLALVCVYLWMAGCIFILNHLLDLGIKTDFFSDITVILDLSAEPILVLVILSIINLNFFGEVVAVLTDEGVYTKKEFIGWDDITKIVFHSHNPLCFRYPEPANFSYTEIFTTKGVRKVSQMPLYFFIKAKKYSSAKCRIKMDKGYLLIAYLFLLMPIVGGILYKLGFITF